MRPHTGGSPNSPQSNDSSSNVPSSTHATVTNEAQSSRHLIFENAIKPSISLIPIKQVNFYKFTHVKKSLKTGKILQEPPNDDYSSDSTLSNSKSNNQRSLTSTPMPQVAEPSSQATFINASSSTSSSLVVQNSSGVSNLIESVTPTSSSLASMIKVGYIFMIF